MNFSVNIADIIALLILLALIIWGAKRGFVKSVFSLGSLLLSLILALTLYPTVTDFLSDSAVGDYVRINVYSVLGAEDAEAVTQTDDGSVLNMPSIFGNLFTNITHQAERSAKEAIANTIADLALKLLGIIVVFILVKLLLWLILTLLNTVSKLPVLRTANKLMGGLAGFCYGIVIIHLILAALAFTTTISTMNKPTEIVLESKYVSVMYHNNVLLNFLK